LYNTYGSNVYKKYQVNMGNPYPVKPRRAAPAMVNKEPEVSVAQQQEDLLENTRQQAEQILQKAMREADDMLIKAQEKIAAHMSEVEQKAKEEGYRNGERLAQKHYQSLLQEAEELRQQAGELYQNTVLSLEGQMVETILEIGRKVIDTELSQKREVILSLIRKTLQSTSPSGEIIVTVSPQDYDTVIENKERLTEGVKNIRDIVIKKDNSLHTGGCIVETGFGSVDSSVETQMKAIEDTFREILGGPEDGEAAASEESDMDPS
jgi:flagellar assembly protein FliH